MHPFANRVVGNVDVTAQHLLACGQTLLPGLVALKGMNVTLETTNSKIFNFCNRETARCIGDRPCTGDSFTSVFLTLTVSCLNCVFDKM